MFMAMQWTKSIQRIRDVVCIVGNACFSDTCFIAQVHHCYAIYCIPLLAKNVIFLTSIKSPRETHTETSREITPKSENFWIWISILAYSSIRLSHIEFHHFQWNEYEFLFSFSLYLSINRSKMKLHHSMLLIWKYLSVFQFKGWEFFFLVNLWNFKKFIEFPLQNKI